LPTDILTTAIHHAQSDVPRPLAHFSNTGSEMRIDTQPKHDTAATVAVASVSDQDWYISRTHGVYHIPACGEKVKTGVAVCKHCHAILDPEKAAQHGLGPGANARTSPASPAAAPTGSPAAPASAPGNSRPAEKTSPR
jgi:hypothetical protein